MKNIKAFIFDMDDTILESENLNVQLISRFFGEQWGVMLDQEDSSIVYGHAWPDVYAHLINRYKLQTTVQAIYDGVMDFKKNYLSLHKLRIASGLPSVLGLPLRKVIVSGSGRSEIALMMDNVGLAHHFDAMFSVDDYLKGKPDPAGFQLALQYLGIAPHEALVFEDSRSGILSARNAGIKSVFMHELSSGDYADLADMAFVDFHAFYDYYQRTSTR